MFEVMKTIITIFSYLFWITLFIFGAKGFSLGIIYPAISNTDGLIETKLFAVGFMLSSLSGALFQYRKTKVTKFLFFGFLMFTVSAHSIAYTIRTYPNEKVTSTDIFLLITLALINIYIFYLSYKFRQVK
jgi:hypothetical protein